MIYIDFEGRTPVNTPINPSFPEWKPWAQKEWNEWLRDSMENLRIIKAFHNQKKIKERNAFIDSKSAHWGKLRLWLQVLSNGKCWFSEVRELYSHYEVEHFRPKKECRGIDGTAKDGYWWLAFDYTNYRLCGNVGNRKKGGWFPLKAGSLISTAQSRCEKSEEAYFIDPTIRYDVSLIAFDETGDIIPNPDCSEWEISRVEETRKRLKLNEHERLVEERRFVWRKMTGLIENYYEALLRCRNGGDPYARGVLNEVLKQMVTMIDAKSELSAVAHWCLLMKNDKNLVKLVA
ncbi:MAG TPA: hypothetical protein VHP36_09105 [Chitinispirillaceae bacterium]|nr:hypothetical protein [Chitinispirillaceae bacterium]